MRVVELVDRWEAHNQGQRTNRMFSIHLPVKEAAQVLALAELYPDCTEDQILADLIGVALKELNAAMPYKEGERQIAVDEFGDPVYEDAGMTPKFISLSRKYRKSLQDELN